MREKPTLIEILAAALLGVVAAAVLYYSGQL